MSQIIENDKGEEIEVFTADEVAKQTETAVAAVKADTEKTVAEKEAEIMRLRTLSAEKTENFRKYNEMTEDQKKAHSENEIIQIRRADKLEEELSGVKKTLEEKEAAERGYLRSTTLKNYHGDKEDVKKLVEEKYAILAGMPETTPEEIQARAKEAAKLAGISVNSINPIYQGFSGEAPQFKEKTEFTETEGGKTAADLVRSSLGIKSDK